jgi:hypothetical protein
MLTVVSKHKDWGMKTFFHPGNSTEGKVSEQAPSTKLNLTFNFASFKDAKQHSNCLLNEKMDLEFCTNSLNASFYLLMKMGYLVRNFPLWIKLLKNSQDLVSLDWVWVALEQTCFQQDLWCCFWILHLRSLVLDVPSLNRPLCLPHVCLALVLQVGLVANSRFCL